jgi:hypothetical protein
MYLQIYHTWIHPLHCSSSSLFPNFWNSFKRYHFCTYIHGITLFALHSSSYPFPATCPLPLVPDFPPQKTFSTLLFYNFIEEKNTKDKIRNMVFLLLWDKDSYTRSFHAYMYCSPSWLFSTSPLHYFLFLFPRWPWPV